MIKIKTPLIFPLDLFQQDLEKNKNTIRDRGSSVCPAKKSHWKTIRGIITLGKGELSFRGSSSSFLSLFSKKVSKPPYLHPLIYFEVTIHTSSVFFQNVSG